MQVGMRDSGSDENLGEVSVLRGIKGDRGLVRLHLLIQTLEITKGRKERKDPILSIREEPMKIQVMRCYKHACMHTCIHTYRSICICSQRLCAPDLELVSFFPVPSCEGSLLRCLEETERDVCEMERDHSMLLWQC